jgi:hypothetical protein
MLKIIFPLIIFFSRVLCAPVSCCFISLLSNTCISWLPLYSLFNDVRVSISAFSCLFDRIFHESAALMGWGIHEGGCLHAKTFTWYCPVLPNINEEEGNITVI